MSIMFLLASASSPALAQDTRCSLQEADYPEVRKSLRKLRRAQGHPVIVAGDGAACEDALDVIIHNDPLLSIRRVDAPEGDTIPYMTGVLAGAGESCGAVLQPSEHGWALVSVGQCRPIGETHQRMLTFAYWEPRGVSFRWNEDLTAGVSWLIDGAYQIDGDALGELGPSWRAMAGFDLSQGPLAGPYVGVRGGVRHATFTDEEDLDALFNIVVGRKWINGSTGFQLGGGVMARVPLGEGIQQETILPSIELRIGVAPKG